MNVNIYLDEELSRKVSSYMRQNKVSRSMLIRKALEHWLEKQERNEWPEGFFEFSQKHEFPKAEELRDGLTKSREIEL